MPDARLDELNEVGRQQFHPAPRCRIRDPTARRVRVGPGRPNSQNSLGWFAARDEGRFVGFVNV